MDITKFSDKIRDMQFQAGFPQPLPNEIEGFKKEKLSFVNNWQRNIYSNPERNYFITVDVFFDENGVEIEKIEGFDSEDKANNAETYKREREEMSFE